MQPAMVMELVATKTATAATYRFLKASTSAQSLVCNVRRFLEFSASAFTVAFQVSEIETLQQNAGLWLQIDCFHQTLDLLPLLFRAWIERYAPPSRLVHRDPRHIDRRAFFTRLV